MPAYSATLPLVCLSLLCACTPLAAQTRHYSMELSAGTSGRIILVNTSPQTIEAFHFRGTCGHGAMEFSRDTLDGLGKLYQVEPWGRVTLTDSLRQQPTCDWKAGFDAVIYADGTYEGDETAVRILQARRQGIAMAVRSWLDPSARPAWPGCRASKAACDSYWQGANLSTAPTHLSPKTDGLEQMQKKVFEFFTKWLQKVDEDVALKTLDAVFPSPVAPAIDVQKPAESAAP